MRNGEPCASINIKWLWKGACEVNGQGGTEIMDTFHRELRYYKLDKSPLILLVIRYASFDNNGYLGCISDTLLYYRTTLKKGTF